MYGIERDDLETHDLTLPDGTVITYDSMTAEAIHYRVGDRYVTDITGYTYRLGMRTVYRAWNDAQEVIDKITDSVRWLNRDEVEHG